MSDEADPGLETTGAETAVADSPAQDASTGGASADQDSAKAGTPTENGSLADGAEVKNQQAEAAPDPKVKQEVVPDDWKKRHDGQFQANQRLSREKRELEAQAQQFQQQLAELKNQFQGFTPELAQKLRAQHETAALPVWNPKHPEHEGFQKTLAKYQFFQELYNSEQDPAVKESLAKRFQAMVPASERQRISQFEDYDRQERMRMSMDPRGYIHGLAKSLVQEEINSFRENTVKNYQETVSAQQELSGLKQRYPEVATTENLTKVYNLVQQGYPTAAAFHAVRADLLEAKISTATTAKASADEKERLLTGRAAISRDAAVAPKVDLYTEATKIARSRNIPPGDKRFLGIFDELRRKHNIKE